MIRWFEEHNRISWTITLLGAFLIFYISSREFSGGTEALNNSYLSIIYHFSAFFLFSFFFMISVVRGKKRRFFFLSILISILYGVLDEFHQYFVPGRYFSVGDMAIDSFGVIFAFFTYLSLIVLRR